MTSSITTTTINSIDNTYPKSGQNNSTQGFRDNFTQIRENFQYAKADIEALQGNVSNVETLTSTHTSLLSNISANVTSLQSNVATLQSNVSSLSSVDQNTSNNVSLLTHTTYFTIDVAPINVNLLSGTNGQEKVLCVAGITAAASSAGSGNISPITVTVSNAGWVTGGNVGNIMLSNVGNGVTVQFANGRWVCSGNNNATFN
jgi:gas vesicle protein